MTFKLQYTQPILSKEEKTFMKIPDNGMWIYKPFNLNKGNGI